MQFNRYVGQSANGATWMRYEMLTFHHRWHYGFQITISSQKVEVIGNTWVRTAEDVLAINTLLAHAYQQHLRLKNGEALLSPRQDPDCVVRQTDDIKS